MFRGVVRVVAALGLIAAMLVVPEGANGSTAAAAGASFCVDWDAYSSASAPAGSDDLGAVGGVSNTVDGEQRTLADVGGSGIDLRVTWVNDHDGVALDPMATPDFTDLDDYFAAVGGPPSSAVLRYFPKNDQRGTMHLEFLGGGTTNRAPVDVTRLLIGGQRDFTAHPMGVSEVGLRSGGPSGSVVVANQADPNSSATDVDPADGITGLGTAAIIELDHAPFGVANITNYDATRSSFVSTGAFEARDWTIIDHGGATADTIVWDLYGTAAATPAGADPATAIAHGGLSAYIAVLCFDVAATTYDLAVVKTVVDAPTAAVAAGDEVTYRITVANQGDVPAGTFDVTSTGPAGMSYVSDTAAPTGVASGDRRTWTFADLAPSSTVSFDVTMRIDDPTLLSYRCDVEITSDSGDDVDSDPTSDDAGITTWDDHDDPLRDTDGPADALDDHDAAVLSFAPTHSIGNLVWHDVDNSGARDDGELPISGVWVELFTDDDSDGLPDDRNADGKIDVADAVATTGTDADGLYLFDGLAAGRYIVAIPPMEWDEGGPLVGMVSSGPTAADSDLDVDGDDDGTEQADGYVMSTPVELGDGEPTGELVDNDAVTPDDRENLTVDFGFFTPVFDLALRKQLADGTNSAVVAVGDPVTFRITVFNQGNVSASGLEVIDYVPDGLTVDDPAWTVHNDGTATRHLDDVQVAPGGAHAVTITMRVGASIGDNVANLAEIADAQAVDGSGDPLFGHGGAVLADIDSVPDRTNAESPSDDAIANESGDEDDHDIARVLRAADGSGGGTLPATGTESSAPFAVLALFVGGLLLVLERARNRDDLLRS